MTKYAVTSLGFPRLDNVLLSKNFIYLSLSEIYLCEHVNVDVDCDVVYVIASSATGIMKRIPLPRLELLVP